mmetsp:Transcript_29067/g.81803  ORF Transcript_29067/g.81803 Transcript_29067/m.81803 type:complete len:282 (+) Transcript_29067:408-1253(+)
MAVELRDDHAAHVHGARERRCLVEHGLALRRIHDENGVVGTNCRSDFLHLLQQPGLLLVPTRRVDDDELVLVLHELLHAFGRDGHWIRLRVGTVERDAELGGVLLQLVEGSGTERVRAHHGRLPAAPLVVVGELGDGGRLSGALQSDEEHDVGLGALHGVRLALRRQQPDELLHDDLLDGLADVGRRALILVGLLLVVLHDVLHPALDVLAQRHDQLDVDVGFDQGPRDVIEQRVKVLAGDASRRHIVELPQRAAQLPAQVSQHHGGLVCCISASFGGGLF